MKEFGDKEASKTLLLCTDKNCELNSHPTYWPSGMTATMADGHEALNTGHEVVAVYVDKKHPLPSVDAATVLQLTEVRIPEDKLR